MKSEKEFIKGLPKDITRFATKIDLQMFYIMYQRGCIDTLEQVKILIGVERNARTNNKTKRIIKKNSRG